MSKLQNILTLIAFIIHYRLRFPSIPNHRYPAHEDALPQQQKGKNNITVVNIQY